MTDHGPSNVTRLAIHIASQKAIPSGGGLGAGICWLMDKDRRSADLKAAFDEAHAYVAAVKTAPDNPYGDDDEAIAGAILKAIDERKKGKP